jgi:hypothetical protein
MGRECETHWTEAKCIGCFGQKTLKGKPPGTLRHRCENNIKTHFKERNCRVWAELIWIKTRTSV